MIRKFQSIIGKEALDGFYKLTKLEGIIPALESSHVIAYGSKLVFTLSKDKIIIIIFCFT